jgi:3'-phosphoadenosine 5'-phosphosulfate sulfotransferase (PAPS reductase)/FAD synthetase
VKTFSPREFVQEYAIKSLVCCFSGGKDSLVATHYVMSELEGVDIDKYVVHVDTGVMLPTTRPFVEDVCPQFGWNLKILHGNFFAKAERYGMPTMFRRWCCWECKLKPIAEFTKTLRPQRAEVTGLRRDESVRRSKIQNMVYYLKKGHVWKYAPILFWTEKQVLNYIKKHDLPMPPHYRLGIKETCQCGAFSSKKQMMILKAQFPELFQKFLELEKNFKKGGAAFYFDNKPCYAKELAEQKTFQEFG